MGEFRLTFETRDFGSISQVLIDMGISFRVEPVKGAEGETVRALAPQMPGSETRRGPKPGRKTGSAKAARAKVYEEWVRDFGNDRGELILHAAKGCEVCNNTGYKGRLGLHELLVGTDRIMANSAGDWGRSDQLAVPELMLEMRRRGHAEEYWR